jgi:hypothetical protein
MSRRLAHALRSFFGILMIIALVLPASPLSNVGVAHAQEGTPPPVTDDTQTAPLPPPLDVTTTPPPPRYA